MGIFRRSVALLMVLVFSFMIAPAAARAEIGDLGPPEAVHFAAAYRAFYGDMAFQTYARLRGVNLVRHYCGDSDGTALYCWTYPMSVYHLRPAYDEWYSGQGRVEVFATAFHPLAEPAVAEFNAVMQQVGGSVAVSFTVDGSLAITGPHGLALAMTLSPAQNVQLTQAVNTLSSVAQALGTSAVGIGIRAGIQGRVAASITMMGTGVVLFSLGVMLRNASVPVVQQISGPDPGPAAPDDGATPPGTVTVGQIGIVGEGGPSVGSTGCCAPGDPSGITQ